MQGYILNIVKVKEEDLIVSVLTQNKLKTLYRFYGARHSQINLGFKIDFISIFSVKSKIPMLREVLHLGFSWQFDRNKFSLWQDFCKLLFKHLKDVEDLDEFYFLLLEDAVKKIQKQNPKRVLVEKYIELLEFEGRLSKDFYCFICEDKIEDEIILKRGYLPSHKYCLVGKIFKKAKIKELFETKSTLFLDDDEVEILWQILLEGL